MPLSDNTETAQAILGVFKDLAGGPKPGLRPAHAKGLLASGKFVPSPSARTISFAPHFNNESTPVIVRFSSSTGHPTLPDSDPNGNPRGIAVRFVLATEPRREHTDVIAHSTPFFPAATPDEALAFFKAVRNAGADPETLNQHIASHPAAQAFLAAPKPFPKSFAHEQFYGLNAYKFTNGEGKVTAGRYQIRPVAGLETLDAETVKGQSSEFLYDGVRQQLSDGEIKYDIVLQLAGPGDNVDDNTAHWPDSNPVVTLGTVTLDSLYKGDDAAGAAAEQKYLIFDPVPRVQGIEPSQDPLIGLRADVYLISGKERRAA